MIRVEGLRKTFPGAGYPAVDGVSLEVAEGALFTLLGPSGCGKTTTLRCLAGLEQPDEGEIWIGQELVFSSSARVNVPPHRRRIGMVFQSYAIWPHMTVAQNVAYPLKNHTRDRATIDQAVGSALELVGLAHLAQRPAPLLSGGEQQRVALARALVERPSLLLLDEPLSNLDAKLREQMRFEIRELQRKLGVTAVYVTHDQDEAFSLSDVMAVMYRGQVVEMGPPEDVYQAPRTARGAEFLGSAAKLAGRVADRDAQGLLLVDTAVGRIPCRCREALPDGSPVDVYVRPEDVTIAPNGRQAVVRRLSFLGSALDWWVDLNGVELRGRSLANSPESAYLRGQLGRPVELSISTARCVAAEKDQVLERSAA